MNAKLTLIAVAASVVIACGGLTSSPSTTTSETDGGTPGSDSGALDGSHPADGGGDASTPTDAGSPTACAIAADCTWGEIPHEILSAADCVCLMGCPFLPQNKSTAARRSAQYDALCQPGTNGNGQPCPVDDCVMPPALACLANECQAAPTPGDAG